MASLWRCVLHKLLHEHSFCASLCELNRTTRGSSRWQYSQQSLRLWKEMCHNPQCEESVREGMNPTNVPISMVDLNLEALYLCAFDL